MTTVDYYLSLNSPWTYLGAQTFTDIVKRHGVKVRVKPTKFLEVFERTGGLPLQKRAPERQAYRLVELARWSAFRGLPFNIHPKFFPCDESKAVRLVVSADQQGLDALRLSLELGRALWEREESLVDDTVLDSAVRRAGLDISELAHDGSDAAMLNSIWELNTKEAIARGVFGAPSYVLPSGEIFWGQDRVDFFDRALAKLS